MDSTWRKSHQTWSYKWNAHGEISIVCEGNEQRRRDGEESQKKRRKRRWAEWEQHIRGPSQRTMGTWLTLAERKCCSRTCLRDPAWNTQDLDATPHWLLHDPGQAMSALTVIKMVSPLLSDLASFRYTLYTFSLNPVFILQGLWEMFQAGQVISIPYLKGANTVH